MLRRILTFGAIVATLGAGACGGGGGHPASSPATIRSTAPPATATTPTPTPTGPPTVPADVPSTGPNLRRPGERAPVMPLAATRHTTAGATEFATFFIRTIDWGYATTSSAYMQHYFQPICTECKNFQRSLDMTRNAHDHYIGGRVTITRTGDGGIGGPHGAELGVVVVFDITSVEAVDARGKFVSAEPAHPGFTEQVWLSWIGDSWSVVFMGAPS